MAWIITHDYINIGPAAEYNRFGRRSDEQARLKLLLSNDLEKTEHFRLFDGDGILCFEGRRTPNDPTPLWFGEADAGCTEMRIYNPTTKNWEIE